MGDVVSIWQGFEHDVIHAMTQESDAACMDFCTLYNVSTSLPLSLHRDTQVLSNDEGGFLSNHDCSRISVLTVVFSSPYIIYGGKYALTVETLPGAIERSSRRAGEPDIAASVQRSWYAPAIFNPSVPYTFSLESTTPPFSRGIIAQVPS